VARRPVVLISLVRASPGEGQSAVFTGLEVKATKAGNTDLAAYWAQVVSHRDAFSARQDTRLQVRTARDAKVLTLVNGKCL
jgi:hypothetical protein